MFKILLFMPLILCAGQLFAGGSSLNEDYMRILKWFPGEYNNEKQVNAQRAEGKQELHELIYHIFKPVKAPAVEGELLFVKQYMDGDYENVYRQRLYSLLPDDETNSIKLTIYSFKDEKRYRYTDKDASLIQQLKPEELRTLPGCEVYWRYDDGFFTGSMIDRACKFFSTRSNKTIYISDTLKLTDKEIWIADQAEDEDGNYVFGNKEGIPHKNDKILSY